MPTNPAAKGIYSAHKTSHRNAERDRTVPVATAIVWSTTFSWGLIGVGKTFETRYPISAD